MCCLKVEYWGNLNIEHWENESFQCAVWNWNIEGSTSSLAVYAQPIPTSPSLDHWKLKLDLICNENLPVYLAGHPNDKQCKKWAKIALRLYWRGIAAIWEQQPHMINLYTPSFLSASLLTMLPPSLQGEWTKTNTNCTSPERPTSIKELEYEWNYLKIFCPKNDQFIGSSELGEVVITLSDCFESNPNQCLFDSFVSNKAGVVTKRNLCGICLP